MSEQPATEQRLVRATVNLAEGLIAGRWAWIEWPPTDYCARLLACEYLVLVDPEPGSPPALVEQTT